MTLNDLISSIRLKIDDVKESRFTKSDVIIAINEGMRTIYNKLIENNIYTKRETTTVTIAAGAREVDFTVDVQKIIHIEDVNQVPIPLVKEVFAHRSNSYAVYAIISSDNRAIGWYTTAPVALDLIVVYAPPVTEFKLTDISDTIIKDIPVEHHNTIVFYAAGILSSINEEQSQWFDMYQDALQIMLNSVRLENDEAKEVVDVVSGTW